MLADAVMVALLLDDGVMEALSVDVAVSDVLPLKVAVFEALPLDDAAAVSEGVAVVDFVRVLVAELVRVAIALRVPGDSVWLGVPGGVWLGDGVVLDEGDWEAVRDGESLPVLDALGVTLIEPLSVAVTEDVAVLVGLVEGLAVWLFVGVRGAVTLAVPLAELLVVAVTEDDVDGVGSAEQALKPTLEASELLGRVSEVGMGASTATNPSAPTCNSTDGDVATPPSASVAVAVKVYTPSESRFATTTVRNEPSRSGTNRGTASKGAKTSVATVAGTLSRTYV